MQFAMMDISVVFRPRPYVPPTMPIHFYCVYCNKQLGIATRKAGQVVTCPACTNQIRVPIPEEEDTERGQIDTSGNPAPEVLPVLKADTPPAPAAVVASAPKPLPASVFEQSNFDDMLNAPPMANTLPSPEQNRVGSRPVPRGVPSPSRGPVSDPPGALPPVRLGNAPLPAATPLPPKPGLCLSPARATMLVVIGVFLVAVAFIIGLVVGRFLGQ